MMLMIFSSMELEDFHDGKYLGDGLVNIVGMVTLICVGKILGGREGESEPRGDRGEKEIVWC